MFELNAVRAGYVGAITSLTALIFVCVAWELWLAPLRPGGSWMVLKVLPLLLPLFGVLHERRKTILGAAILMLLYFIEGAMRGYADVGTSARLALLQAAFSVLFISSAAIYLRASRDRPS